MAARTLRRYGFQSAGAGAWAAVMPVVAAGRALVIGKLTLVTIGGGTANHSLAIGAAAGNAGTILQAAPLGPGEVYTESGLVVLAGEYVYLLTSVANVGAVTIHGEEVDN